LLLAKGLPPAIITLGRQTMDGAIRLHAPALLARRDFVATRLETQLLASAYDLLLPVARGSDRAASAQDDPRAASSESPRKAADVHRPALQRKGA
jgi:hypothetical protein